jgi:DNA-binding transcriptional ArsR family regulator
MADDVFAALGDPTRRWIVEQLSGDGPQTATQLAAALPISRQAVTKHLGSLAEVGLVEPVKEGRETRYSLQPEPLEAAAEWVTQVGARWDQRLDRLRRSLE